MSFTAQVKEELSLIKQPSCCNISECYGMLLCARSFGFEKMVFQTTSEAAAKRCAAKIRSVFDVFAELHSGGTVRKNYRVVVAGEGDRKKIMTAFGYTKPSQFYDINQEIIKKDCCIHAFLRGIFLACGQISDPEKDYRLELCMDNFDLSVQLTLFFKNLGMEMKYAGRGGTSVLYSKDSTVIEEFLTMIGATNSAILVMQSKIYKDMRNKVNRIKNCETANIFKSVDAALEQRTAIELLEKKGKLSSLSPELINAARLRIENPEASLNELCRLSKEPITRSGLNHRFKKLLEIAKELK